jgi:hypothetical protein
MQLRLLTAEEKDLLGELEIVPRWIELSSVRPEPPCPLAQVAARREGEEGLDERAREGDHVRALGLT